MALLMSMHFINFNRSVAVTSEKGKKFACSDYFLIFNTIRVIFVFSKVVLIAAEKVTLFLTLSGFLLAVFSTTFM